MLIYFSTIRLYWRLSMRTKTEKKAITIENNDDITIMKTKTAHLKLKLKDVWGGDGAERFQQFKIPRIERTTKSKKRSSNMPQYESETDRTEIKFDVMNKPVKTFEQPNGKPIYYLGRKITGTMKQIGKNLARMENPLFPSMAFTNDMMTMISITPEIITVGEKNWMTNSNYYLGTSGQEMARGGAFIPLHFDALREVETEIDIKYPECFEKQIMTIINLLQTMKTGNRRMMKIEILDCRYN